MFDDFHYSGPDDPALHAHGWLVRTSPGGPGIHDTWSAAGVSFPAEKSAVGGQVMQLRATTDGTKASTKQAEVQSSGTDFLTGTYAARIYFNDKPTSGRNGDHVNESFYTISPNNSRYSELDNEYMPNGAGVRQVPNSTPRAGTAPTPGTGSHTNWSPAFRAGTPW